MAKNIIPPIISSLGSKEEDKEAQQDNLLIAPLQEEQPPTRVASTVPQPEPLAGALAPISAIAQKLRKRPETEEPDYSAGDIVADYSIDALKGAVELGKSAVGIIDMVTGGLVGKGMRSLGYDPQKTTDLLSDLYSDARKFEETEYEHAEGFWDSARALATNPAMFAGKSVEMMPAMLGMMGAARYWSAKVGASAYSASIARGLTPKVASQISRVAATRAATIAGATAEGMQQGGSSFEDYMADGVEFGKAYAGAIGSGITTGMFGFTGAKIGTKFGLGDIEAQIGSKMKTFAGRFIGHGVQEGVIEELPQSITEQMWNNYVMGRPLMEGTAKAGATGAMLGFGAGAPMGVISTPQKRMGAIETAASKMTGKILPLNQEGAMARAAALTEQGIPHGVVEHPTVDGMFAVIEMDEELAKQVEEEEPTEPVKEAAEKGEPVVGTGEFIPTEEDKVYDLKTEEPAEEVTTLKAIDEAAHEAATSPKNGLEVSQEQLESGDYPKGRFKLQGIDVSIENPKGSIRKGTDESGRAWEQKLDNHYGDVEDTIGADGDPIDVFIGRKPKAENAFVVNQLNPETREFDEHKVMLGFESQDDAEAAYMANYEDGWKGMGNIAEVPIPELRRWMKSDDTSQPFTGVKPITWDSIPNDVIQVAEEARTRPETIAINTPERKQMREDLGKELYGKGAAKQEKRIDVIMGATASGKSTAVAKPLAKKYGSIIIDPDIAKEQIPEYDNGRGAGAVHQESKVVRDFIISQAMERGDNIVLPVVGGDKAKVTSLLDAFTEAGYNVNVSYVDLPLDKSLERSVDRFYETGRLVDPRYIQTIGRKPAENYEALRDEQKYTSYTAYDNNVERGQEAEVIERVTGAEYRLGSGQRRFAAVSGQKAFPQKREELAYQQKAVKLAEFDITKVKKKVEVKKKAPAEQPTKLDTSKMKVAKSTGRIVGAPRGFETAEKFQPVMEKAYETLADEDFTLSKTSRNWYQRSGQAIRTMTRGNKKMMERMTRLLALMSPDTGVLQNFAHAVNYAYDLARDPKTPNRWGSYPNNIQEAIELGALNPSRDFNRSMKWVGAKVENFYRNLHDESFGENRWPDAVTNDRWIARAFDYPTDKLTPQQYGFVSDVTVQMTERYNNEHGTNLKPRQLEAMLWTNSVNHALQEENPEYKPTDFSFGEAAGLARTTIMVEATPSEQVAPELMNLPDDIAAKFNDESFDLIRDKKGNDLILDRLGVALYNARQSEGGYAGGIHANAVIDIVARKFRLPNGIYDKKQADLYAKILQYIFSQESVMVQRAVHAPKVTKGLSKSVFIKFDRDLNPDIEKEIYDHLTELVSDGTGFTKVTKDAIIITNIEMYTGLDNTAFLNNMQNILNDVHEELGVIDSHESWVETNLNDEGVEHDWNKDPEGQRLQDQIGDATGRDLLDWVRGRHEAHQAIIQKYQQEAVQRRFGRGQLEKRYELSTHVVNQQIVMAESVNALNEWGLKPPQMQVKPTPELEKLFNAFDDTDYFKREGKRGEQHFKLDRPYQDIVAAAIKELTDAGLPIEALNNLDAIMSFKPAKEGDGTLAFFVPRNGMLDGNPPYLAVNSEALEALFQTQNIALMKNLRWTLAHELGHALDVGSTEDGHSNSMRSPLFEIDPFKFATTGADTRLGGRTVQQAKAFGAITKEMIHAFETKTAETDGFQQMLMYPMMEIPSISMKDLDIVVEFPNGQRMAVMPNDLRNILRKAQTNKPITFVERYIAHEIGEGYAEKVMDTESKLGRIKGEVFAQMHAMFYVAPNILKKHAPIAYQFVKEVTDYGNKGLSAREFSEALRKHFQAKTIAEYTDERGAPHWAITGGGDTGIALYQAAAAGRGARPTAERRAQLPQVTWETKDDVGIEPTQEPLQIFKMQDVAASPNFKAWFGNSKIVDEDGNPKEVYHGTTHDFDQFTTQYATPESYMGIGFYFSDEIDDINANYAGEGADLTQRIQRETEKIDDIMMADLLAERDDIDAGEAEIKIAKMGDIEREDLREGFGREQLNIENEGAIMPVFVRMENPVEVEPDGGTMLTSEWDQDYYKDMAKDEVEKDDFTDDDGDLDEDGYNDAIDEKTQEIFSEDYNPKMNGNAANIMEVLRSAAYEYGIDGAALQTKFAENFETYDLRIPAYEFSEWLRGQEETFDAYDDDGNLSGYDLVREVFEQLGFDGIIMNADAHFGKRRFRSNPFNQGMAGIYGDTKHYVAFNGDQIKSSIGNVGDYGQDPSIVMSNKGKHFGREAAAVQADVDAIRSTWKNAPNIKTVSHRSMLPNRLRKEASRSRGRVEAVFDAETETVYMIADTIPAMKDVQRILLHEVFGHWVPAKKFGKDFEPLLELVAASTGNKLQGIAERHGVSLATKEGRLIATQEYMAEIAELGLNPTLLNRLVLMFKNIAASLGFNVKLSDSDIKVILANAGRMVFEGDSALIGDQLVPLFSQTRETFYSQMKQHLGQKLPNKGKVGQLKIMINNMAKKGQFKNEELGWSGLNEWLDEQTGEVTKEEIVEFLDANEIVIEEVGEDQDKELLLSLAPKESLDENIIAHIRLNKRTEANGKRVLLIEDDQYSLSVFKRMTRYASENGFDRVEWMAGEQKGVKDYDVILPKAAEKYINKWDGKVSLQKDSAREPFFDGAGVDKYAGLSLDPMDKGMNAATDNNKILNAVVSSLPVNVMNVLSSNNINAENFARNPQMFTEALSVDATLTVTDGLRSSLSQVGANLRAGLYSSYKAGLDKEIIPALRASDLKTSVVSGLFDADIVFKSEFGGAGLGAESGGFPVGFSGGKLGLTELTNFINWHKKLSQHEGDVIISEKWRFDITPKMRDAALDGQVLFSATDEQATKTIKQWWYDKADRIIDGMNRKLQPTGSLPLSEMFLGIRRHAMGRIAKVNQVVSRIRDILGHLTPEEMVAVYEYLTHKDAGLGNITDRKVTVTRSRGLGRILQTKQEKDLRTEVQAIKRLISNIGRELVERGLIPVMSYEHFRDSYLPRLYLAHLLDDKTFNTIASGNKPSTLGWTKYRNEDMPELERVILGQIKDPAYLAGKTVGTTLRDIAILDFISEVSKVDEWIMPQLVTEYNGRRVTAEWLLSESERILARVKYLNNEEKAKAQTVALDMKDVGNKLLEAAGLEGLDYTNFKQVPSTPRYGAMRGLWVRTEIYDDLVGSVGAVMGDSFAEKMLANGGYGTKLTRLWKMSKVALNPPSQVRNFVSNLILINIYGGVPLHKIPKLFYRAFDSVKTNGKYWRMALHEGTTESTFAANELFRLNRDLIKLKSQSGKLGVIEHMQLIGGVVTDWAGDIYQFSEAIGKTMMIIHGVETLGLDPTSAGGLANQTLFDYSHIDPNVRYLRNAPVGMPFITFYYKVFPNLVEVALKHPQRFAPYLAIPYVISQAIAKSHDVDDDDIEALKESLTTWMRKKGSTMILPIKDEHGRWQVFDYGYFMPWGMFADVIRDTSRGELGEAIKTSGLFGGIVPDLITALKTGKDSFTGRPIYHDEDPPQEQFKDIMTYLWRMSMPTWTTDIGAATHTYRALTGRVDPRTGEPTATLNQALGRWFGMNVYPIDPEYTRARNLQYLGFELSDIESRLKRRMGDRNLKPKDQQELLDAYTKFYDKKLAEAMDYQKRSYVHPNLRVSKDKGRKPPSKPPFLIKKE